MKEVPIFHGTSWQGGSEVKPVNTSLEADKGLSFAPLDYVPVQG